MQFSIVIHTKKIKLGFLPFIHKGCKCVNKNITGAGKTIKVYIFTASKNFPTAQQHTDMFNSFLQYSLQSSRFSKSYNLLHKIIKPGESQAYV